MFTMKEYVCVKSLEEAYTLLTQRKNNKILGGLLWLRMGSSNIHTGIDLRKLGLDTIKETEEEIRIGSMCTLRQLETSPILQAYADGIISDSVANIVGVQFRNSATVGGSIYSRFGFSDLLTGLMVLDAKVKLYDGGAIPLNQFAAMPYTRDIVEEVIIHKEKVQACYLTHRKTSTDFPVITVAVAKGERGFQVAVGARPHKAILATDAMNCLNKDNIDIEKAAMLIATKVEYGSNLRGSKEYRAHLTKVLATRAINSITNR